MKRVGARGEGSFERISWDEALETVAAALKRVRSTYGNPSILLIGGSGGQVALNRGPALIGRLLSLFGGYTGTWGNLSSEGCIFAVRAQYNEFACGNSRDDLLNSKLIILWGWDPAKVITGTNATYYLVRAKEAGAKIISVDPIYHDTAAAYADQWIPIRPGTDAAMMAAMAYVMLKENLHDQKFLDRYTFGFAQYQDYVLGVEDGIAKTPEWAETITGVPARTIKGLAREYATTKPAALMDHLGPARGASGEQITRSAMTLAAMTGNVGIPGGSAGGGLQRIPVGEMHLMPTIPQPRNPMDDNAPSVRGTVDVALRLVTRVHSNMLWDAILRGKAGGYPADFKFAYVVASNPMSSRSNTNKGAEALKHLEFIVSQDIFMTSTSRYADILLPVCGHLEKEDLLRPWPSGPYYVYTQKAIEPLYESKPDFEIACALAAKMGIDDFNDKTAEEWLKEFVARAPDTKKEITDFEKFRREGVHRINLAKPIVAFRKQIEDPEKNPFATATGKIEIYSELLAKLNSPLCPPVPKYVEMWEGHNDPLARKYPLQLITPHPRRRVHSILDNVSWLREIEEQSVWINSADARARGIADGEKVAVFNDRGTTVLPARVTGRIMQGVVCIYEGAWYQPDEKGIDHGGCANVLTQDTYSPGGALPSNTALVEIRKA